MCDCVCFAHIRGKVGIERDGEGEEKDIEVESLIPTRSRARCIK